MVLLNFGYLFARLFTSHLLVAVGVGLYTSYTVQHMTQANRSAVYVFWDTIDEILNYVLFFIVGFQVVFVDISQHYLIAMSLAVLVNFLVRVVSVSYLAINTSWLSPKYHLV